MKKYINYMLSALFFGTAFAACADDDYTELNKENKEQSELALTSSTDNIVLDEQVHGDEAIVLSWTTGTNYGTGNRIAYTLELAEAGSGFAAPVGTDVNSATQVYTWTKSVEELNDLLRENFGVADGQSISLEARVTAAVAGMEEKQVAVSETFQVTTYKPVSTTLYLIGDATPNGWSADDASEMKRTDNGIFTWTGQLTEGSFKFITTQGSFLPSYNKGTDGQLVLRTSEDEPDEQYTIEEAHYYQVDVNLLTGQLTLTQTEAAAGRFEALYFVGGLTGWNFETMRTDILDPYLFRLGRYIGPNTDNASDYGEFKFGTVKGWDDMLMATTPNASYTSTGMTFGGNDTKWFLKDDELDKAYKICVDTREGAERMMMQVFEPYAMIYLVGDAAPNGWSLDDATAMTADASDPYTFSWTGTLNTGELKFTCDKQSDWCGAWFLADEAGKTPTGEEEQMLFVDKSDEAFKNQYLDIVITSDSYDYKWNIREAGTYTITLDQLKETITIAKQ